MSSTSRSGLVPTPKRILRKIKKRRLTDEHLPLRFEATPMPLSMRPYGGLFNPFAKGCSVLCNHPASTEVKDIINQLKTSLAIEGKNVQQAKEKYDNTTRTLRQHAEHDNIPEDLFRRYTDTDSRPLTPTPTITSVHTRTSASSFLNRRCITPEWGKHEVIKRKKIILDLRRSHSQETLYWKPSSDLSQSIGNDGLSGGKPKSAGANEEKKPKRQKSEEQRPKSSMAAATMPEEGDEEPDDGIKKLSVPQTCINEHSSAFDDEDIRRGKKRKKLKPTPATTTFHLSEDPETQVATLGPDSLNPSTRPSLIPNSISLLPNKEKRESEPVLLKGSFLTDEAFQVLKTELDVDVIENTFGRYLNRARREAIKFMPNKAKSIVNASVMVESEKLPHSDLPEQKMPRKFSKSATRFDVPLNMKSLETMTSLDYLSQYVWVSRQRKQLYKRIFLKYLTKIEGQGQEQEPAQHKQPKPNQTKQQQMFLGLGPAAAEIANPDEETHIQRAEYIERTMSVTSLSAALEDVLEFHGTKENIDEVLRLLDYENVVLKRKQLDFRSWCGIVSFAERLALSDPTCTDSCDELEKADFNSMEQRLEFMEISSKLREVLNTIRKTHNLSF